MGTNGGGGLTLPFKRKTQNYSSLQIFSTILIHVSPLHTLGRLFALRQVTEENNPKLTSKVILRFLRSVMSKYLFHPNMLEFFRRKEKQIYK